MEETIIIVGGLSAGPSAAAKARRVNEGAKILLFEKTEYISYATCGIPYSLSGTIKKRDKLLVVKPELLRDRFGIDVHLNEPVIDILPDQHKIITSKGEYKYTKLIYAAGASPFVPPIKDLDLAENWTNCRTIEEYDKIVEDKVLTESKNITVLGAGLIGVEVADICPKFTSLSLAMLRAACTTASTTAVADFCANILPDNPKIKTIVMIAVFLILLSLLSV